MLTLSPLVFSGTLAWIGVSAILTALLRLRSDADWIKVAERSPRLGGVVAFVRAFGFDPIGALAAIRLILARPVVLPPLPPVEAERETLRTGLADPRAVAASAKPASSPTGFPISLVAISLGALLALAGCAAVPTACRTIDTLEKACTILVVRGPDGTRREVRVTPDELEALGQRALARESADAGTP